MSICSIQQAGTVELYFYGELDAGAHAKLQEHLGRCRECAQALEELQVIRSVLSARPDVAAPGSGEWTTFMQRLDAALDAEALARATAAPSRMVSLPRRVPVAHGPLAGLLAMAALLAIVAMSVFMASQTGRGILSGEREPAGAELVADGGESGGDPGLQAALTSVGVRHLERSKLVVLGLAAKEPAPGDASDWAYERELATSLLNDTRLYRQAAEQRGLTALAGVMRDLELVLLQTSMAEGTDTAALPQIQRLIHKRGLVEKMDVVGTRGLLP